jgi:RTX calcium-binding nonapeptide repeat (4 copies)
MATVTVTGTAYNDNNTVNGVPNIYRKQLDGFASADCLYGYAGHDYLYGYAGNDILYGGTGNDWAYGGNDHDRIYGDSGTDRLYGDYGNDSLYGGNDNDFVYGDAGTDRLYGEAENDTLYGGTGSDSLNGGSGNDYIQGYGYSASEYDTVTGGLGADKFVLGDSFQSHYSSFGYACIADFKWEEGDKIQVKGALGNYTLNKTQNWCGGAGLDTAIYKGGDLIGVVADRTDVYLNLDFVVV